MSEVTLDDRGRLTLPIEIRERVQSRRFIAYYEEGVIKLVPIPDPEDVKGSIDIPWTIEELEEAGEGYVLKRG
ncbi:MAG: AbrB/MazE/SpoVT family DNA-binding domain-containing protein [Candidatus Bathyarchaeia archaeon]